MALKALSYKGINNSKEVKNPYLQTGNKLNQHQTDP